MVVAIERGRDAIGARPHDTERVCLSMHNQLTTSPLFGDPRLPARFWDKVRVLDDGCWEWQVGKSEGYGRFCISHGNDAYVHRLTYEQLIGSIPDGLTVDHLCRNRACVKPAHLELVSNGVNVLRGVGPPACNARKTHCPRGHPYDLINTRYGRNGGR